MAENDTHMAVVHRKIAVGYGVIMKITPSRGFHVTPSRTATDRRCQRY